MRENEIKIFEMNFFGLFNQIPDFYWNKCMNLVWNLMGNLKKIGPWPGGPYNQQKFFLFKCSSELNFYPILTTDTFWERYWVVVLRKIISFIEKVEKTIQIVWFSTKPKWFF